MDHTNSRPWRRDARGRTTLNLVVLVLTVVTVAGSCRASDPTSEARQPPPAVSAIESGVFDDLPQLPRGQVIGPPSEQQGVITGSYRADGVMPAAVLAYYRANLDHDRWTNAELPHAVSGDAWKGTWVSEDHRLEVAAELTGGAQAATTVDTGTVAPGSEVQTQYSLVLRPR